MIPTIANIRKAIYCLNKRLDLLEGGEYSNTVTELSNKVHALESLLNDDVQNPTATIDKFNEIISFLNSIENTETLQGLLGDISQSIPTKVSDLDNDLNFLTQHQSLNDLINLNNKLNSDLVSDTNQNNKFVTEQEKQSWNNLKLEVNGKITKYIINQTEINGNAKLPEDVIIIETPAKDDNSTVIINQELVHKNVIRRIRDNSHLYIGRYDSTNNKLEIKQVNDVDKTKWIDGTTITYGAEDDLFMKLPKFWWKMNNLAEDIYEVQFCMTEEDIDETWNCWNGNTFIGVYEAIINNNKVYSKSGVTPTISQSWTTFTANARARYNNDNYRIVTYEAHQIMALLGWGWLGTTNCQSIIGAGTSSYPKTTGLCNTKGMSDSSSSVDGNTTSINFWGLENWWGDISEWIDNIKTKDSHGNVNILGDDRTSVIRTIACPEVNQSSYSARCSTKLQFGIYGDVLPKKIIDNSNYNRGFCDYGRVSAASDYVASRSSNAADLNGGLAYLNVAYGAGYVYAYVGSRLLYKGDYIEVDSFTE